MSDWEYIECGFQAADETINFGTRTVAGLDNLFETNTLACVKLSGEISSKEPLINVFVLHGLIYFSVNGSLRVFSDLECSDLCFNIAFKHSIDTFCVTNDCKYIFLCLRNGSLRCLDIERKSMAFEGDLSKYSNNDDNPMFLSCFLERQQQTLCFVVVLKNGKVLRASTNSNNEMESVIPKFELNELIDFKLSIDTVAFSEPLLVLSGELICIFNIITENVETMDGLNLKRIFFLNPRVIIALDILGNLVNICCIDLFYNFIEDDTKYDDVEILVNNEKVSILGLTKPNELGEVYLQYRMYPDKCTVFSLKIPNTIQLIAPENIHDEMIYLSKLKNDDKNLEEFRFQAIREIVPENRLKRLLKRGKFEEAEQFSKLFNLSQVEVQMAKAERIVEKLTCDSNDIYNLLNILDQLSDNSFKINCLLNVQSSCLNFKDVGIILKYGCSLNSIDDLNMINAMHRFETFSSITSTSSFPNVIEKWIDFLQCDLIYEMINYLEKNYIYEALTIFNRLDQLSIMNLNEENIKLILKALSKVPRNDLYSFLYAFLPLTLLYVPSSFDILIKWLIEEVYYLEKYHYNLFPDNAIEFINKTVKLLKVRSSEMWFVHSGVFNKDSLKEIENLLFTLEKLKILKYTHDFEIQLRELLQGPKILFEYLLNPYKIKAIKNNCSLEEFLYTFILNNNLNRNEILVDIIKDAIKYEEKYWENILPALLNLIDVVSIKLDVIFILLKTVNVPWSNVVRDIALAARKYDHPIVDSINNEIEYECKCVIYKKYHLKNALNTRNYFKYVIYHIIRSSQPTMIEDIYKICTTSKEKHQANIILIDHFINIGNPHDIFHVLMNSTTEEIQKCSKTVIKKAKTILMDKDASQTIQDKYYEVLGIFFKQLSNNVSHFQNVWLQHEYDELYRIYNLFKLLNYKLTYDDLESYDIKLKIVQILLNDHILLKYEENNDILSCLEICEKISRYLDLDITQIFSEYCKSVQDFKVIVKIAEFILTKQYDVKYLCYAVQLILENIGSSANNFNNTSLLSITNSSFTIESNDAVDYNVYTDGLILIKKIMSQAILHSQGINLMHCMELSNWVQCGSVLLRYVSGNSTYSLNDNTITNISVLDALRDIFRLYLSFKTDNDEDISSISKISTNLSTQDQVLQSTVTYLLAEGYGLFAYKLIKTLYFAILPENDQNSLKNITNLLKHLTNQQLHSVVSAENLEVNLAFSLTLTCDINMNQYLFEALKSYKRIITKFESVAELYLCFLRHNNINDLQIMCSNIIYLCKWWLRIDNCKLSYRNFFNKEPNNVLEILIELNHMSLSTIKDFCSDFHLSITPYYELYLKNYLICWKPEFTVETDTKGKQKIIIKNDEQILYDKCMEVVNLINNAEIVHKVMNNSWNSINFYHYEVFICIFKILASLKLDQTNNRKLFMITFLKNYTRVSEPGESEMEEWFSLYPECRSIDNLSKWRLPFTPSLYTKKIWNIARNEINLKTYTKWFEVIPFLSEVISQDEICTYAIKNVMSSGIFKTTELEEWILYPKYTELLIEIYECIEHISNLVVATSTLYSLIKYIPLGVDCVNAIKLCYKYAIQYKENNSYSEDVLSAFNKIEKKYYAYSTTHILYTNQLKDKKYLNLVSKSVEELIVELYKDERILKKGTTVTFQFPDFNKIVDELAELHNIDVLEKRKSLIINLLHDNVNFDTSHFLIQKAANLNLKISSDNLLRVSYICTSGDISYWQKWLFEYGNIEANECRNLRHKTNALKCFCNISDCDTIEEITGSTVTVFINFINKLILLNNLEIFGLPLNIEKLDNCNKVELLKRLACPKSNQLSIRNMALVCVTYTIYKSKYWKVIFGEMLKLKMFSDLQDCLMYLQKFFTGFFNQKFYLDAWQAMINNLFNILDLSQKKDELIQNFYIIQSCPIAYSIDFKHVIDVCCKFSRYEFASLTVPFLAKDKQIELITKILQLHQNLENDLDELSSLGLWSVLCVKNILKEIKNDKLE